MNGLCIICMCAWQGETPDADEVFNVINSLRKVSIMYMCHNLNDTNIWDSLFEDLPKCVKENETQMPPQVSASLYNNYVLVEEQVIYSRGGGWPKQRNYEE